MLLVVIAKGEGENQNCGLESKQNVIWFIQQQQKLHDGPMRGFYGVNLHRRHADRHSASLSIRINGILRAQNDSGGDGTDIKYEILDELFLPVK
ncbi:hypothetical protein CHS0354_001841 [Potamilus streckersoni]|uniref:Uncharacterized protein n=1 Tax=Potamilus streckersoni TaxID=2493646 RepID=A0AAE0VRH5_9BIVA|nr:hypothetical protein CHS0354_001841 [Potamilus streckersoni]